MCGKKRKRKCKFQQGGILKDWCYAINPGPFATYLMQQRGFGFGRQKGGHHINRKKQKGGWYWLDRVRRKSRKRHPWYEVPKKIFLV